MAARAILLLALLTAAHVRAAPPVVSGVTLAQRTDGSGLVDIGYDLSDAEGDTCAVAVLFSDDAGATWDMPALNLSGDVGAGVVPGSGRLIVWDAGAVAGLPVSDDVRVRVVASDAGVAHRPHSPANVAITDFSLLDWTDEATIEAFARADFLQLAAAPLWDGGTSGHLPVLDGLRALNPDIKVVGYVSAKTAQLSGASPSAEPFWHQWYQRTRPFWVYTTTGDTASDFPGNVIVNILDENCRREMIDTIVEFQRGSLNQFDGVYWDYFGFGLWIHPDVTATGDPDMDGDGIGHFDDADERAGFRAAHVALVSALRDSLGDGFIQVFNGQRAYSDSTFAALGDGLMYELFPTLFYPQPDMQHALDPSYPYSLVNVRRWLRDANGGPFMVLANTQRNYYFDENFEPQLLVNGDQFRAVALLTDTYSSWHTNDSSTYSNTYAWTGNDITLGAPLGPTTYDGPFIRRDFRYGRVEIEMTSGRYPDPFEYRIWNWDQLVEELAIPYRYP